MNEAAGRPPHGTRDPRRGRIARLLRDRIGGNAEDFYRDGCAIVEDGVVLDAGSHILGHCAREIESAAREVLVALLIPPKELATLRKQAGADKATQRAEVEEIVRRLRLQADAAEVGLWLELSDRRAASTSKALHAIAHRQAHRHAPPMDDEVRELWRRFELLLIVLLRELEARFADLLPKARELAERPNPGDKSVKRFNELPSAYVLRREFFDYASAGWLPRLDADGAFEDVPRLSVDPETGATMIQHWPTIDYLARMLALPAQRDLALTIVERVAIPHEFAEWALLKAGRTLNGEHRRRYARHLVTWIAAQPYPLVAIAMDAADLAAELAAAGDGAEAARILDALLTLKADPRAVRPNGEEDEARWFSATPQGRVDEYDYERVIERGMRALVGAAPTEAFGVALPLLEKALELSERPGLVAERVDLSPFWMPSLAAGTTRHGHRHPVLLAGVVRESALATIDASPAEIDPVLTALDASRWTVCRRLALLGRQGAARHRARITSRTLATSQIGRATK